MSATDRRFKKNSTRKQRQSYVAQRAHDKRQPRHRLAGPSDVVGNCNRCLGPMFLQSPNNAIDLLTHKVCPEAR